MSTDPKQLKDYSSEVKAAVPEIVEEAYKEAADSWSTAHICAAIIKLCGDLRQWKALNDQIHLIAKRRAQLKKAIQASVQEAMNYLESAPDKATKLELIETLRTVSAGKIFVEIELARLTVLLAKMKEEEGNIAGASETMQEIQVETVGSMEAAEKLDLLLEQMRLCLENHDYVRCELTAEKVSKKMLSQPDNQDRKLKYHRLMIRFFAKKQNYLDTCKSYRAIYETPKVQEDAGQWQEALSNASMYLLLAPFDYEFQELLNRTRVDKKLEDLLTCKAALTLFATDELTAWPLSFESEWRAHPIFRADSEDGEGEKRFQLLKKRVVQHNIRVISKYYARITFPRLAALLQLDEDTAEEYLSEVVCAKQLHAKIDRPAKIVVFSKKPDTNVLLNDWSSDVGKLLSLVEESCHMINKEMMLHGVSA